MRKHSMIARLHETMLKIWDESSGWRESTQIHSIGSQLTLWRPPPLSGVFSCLYCKRMMKYNVFTAVHWTDLFQDPCGDCGGWLDACFLLQQAALCCPDLAAPQEVYFLLYTLHVACILQPWDQSAFASRGHLDEAPLLALWLEVQLPLLALVWELQASHNGYDKMEILPETSPWNKHTPWLGLA